MLAPTVPSSSQPGTAAAAHAIIRMVVFGEPRRDHHVA